MHSSPFNWLLAVLAAGMVMAGGAATKSFEAVAADLPVPCIAGSCGAAVPSFVSSGAANAVSSGNTLTITQTSNSAILNWQSFNVSPDGQVNFVQPSAAALAVNRIYQAEASRIFGSINANGQIYLLNQNGILFGAGSKVNVGGLLASTLDISPTALSQGITSSVDAAFRPFTDANGVGLPSGNLSVATGAQLTATGGQVFLFAPRVDNQGTIRTPDSQAILAAGNSVFLTVPSDPNLRGLLVQVGDGGTVTNGSTANEATTNPADMIGQIIAERGNVTLAGLAVNQNGRVSATTSMLANGSIRLVAGDATGGGALLLGRNSRTEVGLDSSDTATTVDVNAQPHSTILLDGRSVTLASGANVLAPSGDVSIFARVNQSVSPTRASSDGSRLLLENGAVVDVSGATAVLPIERNVIAVELRGSQVANSPNQRDGPLRGQTVFVDIRRSGTRADGTPWQATPLADVSGDISTIARGVVERNLIGGSVRLQSQGDVIVAGGAQINTSGGKIQYADGYINTTTLVGADGKLYDIGNAAPNLTYTGIANSNAIAITDARWGVTRRYSGLYGNSASNFASGYVEGKDAGSLTITAPHVIFDGTYRAHTDVGPNQRSLSGAIPSANLYRPFDQLPLAGLLQIGATTAELVSTDNNFIEPAVAFSSAPILPFLRNANGSAFDPRGDPFPNSLSSVNIIPSMVGPEAAGRISIFSNGSVSVPRSVDLRLPAGGSFSVLSGSVDIGGTISAAGGSINLQTVPTLGVLLGTGGVHLRSGAQLNVAGSWINDSPLSTSASLLEPLVTNGGSTSINVRDGELQLDSASVIDVSGGARLTYAGTLTPGRAGSISLVSSAAASSSPPPFVLGSSLRGYAFASGGTLTLNAGRVCVSSLATNCGTALDAGTLLLPPDMFRSGGFANFNIAANQRGFLLAAQTQLTPQQQNYLPSDALFASPGSTTLPRKTVIGFLADIQRQPANVTFSSRFQLAGGQAADSATLATAPFLELGQGSQIVADPQARIQLSSDTRIAVNGSLSAPSGQIGMTLTSALNASEYAPTQAIWLGDGARLDVSGLARLRPDDVGHQLGQVLPGGTVTINAQRGAVITSPGSMIDVSGASALVDVPVLAADGQSRFERRSVASASGSVTVTAAEAALLSGALRAQSGSPGQVAGGTFSLTLDGNNRYGTFPFFSTPPFPFTARRIDLAQTSAPIVLSAGSALPAAYQGRALISANNLMSAGFDALRIEARSLDTAIDSPVVAGEIHIVGNVDLGMGRSLALDASTIVSSGGASRLAAPYLAIGQSYRPTQNAPLTPTAGSGSLQLNAQLIDVIGNSALSGFGNAALISTEDIRLRGLQGISAGDIQRIVGSLSTPGSISFRAQQIYPTTLTQFSVQAGTGTSGAIDILPIAGTASPVLSAGGALTLVAPQINQGGVLRAPFGSLTLNSQQVNLSPASITSTSAVGAVIPFGETQGGFDWAYRLQDEQTLVFGASGRAVPAQHIALNGALVNVQSDATISAAGGGDLLATEFVPGVGGSVDVLSAAARPDAFAVLPVSSLSFAPFDPFYYAGSTIRPGDSVYLAGGNGLPAGTYAILPARYALLPGAYYVRPVAGFQDITANLRLAQNDGSLVVAGYLTSGGTQLAASRTSGFSIRPGREVLREAAYTSTSGNFFFSSQAASAGVAATRLPRDAGTVLFNAGSRLVFNGALNGSPVSGGRGVAVDLTSDAIRVVADASSAPTTGGLVIIASGLNRLGAESLLIGGVRSAAADGIDIETRASTVDIDSGAQLTAPEILLVGSQRVAVNSGASLTAERTLAGVTENIGVSGDGALLRVASSGDPSITRTAATGAGGVLNFANGATISAVGGSVALEGSGAVSVLGNFNLAGGALALTSDQINLGAVPAQTAGASLSTQQLSGLGLNQLSLTSRGNIDFYGDVNLATRNLSLRGGQLRGIGAGTTQLAASGLLTLSGRASGNIANTSTGSALLQLTAAQFLLDSGVLAINGFSTTKLTGSNNFTINGSGALAIGGDLNISSSLLTASSGADRNITVAGNFSYSSTGVASNALTGEATLGANIGITAQSILFAGRATLRAGLLSLTANGSANGAVMLNDGSLIDLSDTTTSFDTVTTRSGAGKLTLASMRGNVIARSGAVIDVSSIGGQSIDAGGLNVSAALGTVDLAGTMRGQGADFSVDAFAIAGFGALNARLGSAGFSGVRSYRLRGPGDLVVGPSPEEAIAGRSISLTADQGAISIAGTISSHTPSGGNITLSALGDVAVTGRLDATPSLGSSDRNGSIELRSDQGRVLIQQSATLAAVNSTTAALGASDGRLLVRAPQAGLATLLDANLNNHGVVIAGDVSHIGSIVIEGFRRYNDLDGVIDAAEVAPDGSNILFADASTFVAQSAGLRAGLGSIRGPSAQFVPGIEIVAPQSLTLASDWLLNDWRFNGSPGFLTLRAGGDLIFNRSLSDGFSASSGSDAFRLVARDASWSYRLVAGADLTSANPLSTLSVASLADGAGSLRIAPGVAGNSRTPAAFVMIRTGTGDIDVAAARNIQLGNAYSMIYTSGIASDGIRFNARGQLLGLLYPTFGGDVRLRAGQDVIGAPGNQIVTDWLWRVGRNSSVRGSSTAWTVNFAQFAQNVGALGGGDVTVDAARDISNLGVMIPTVGRQVGGTTPASNNVQIIGGGNATLSAGRNVAGGMIYDGRGTVNVRAGDQIGASPTLAGVYPVLALGDSRANIVSRRDTTLATVVNPTLIPQGGSQSAGIAQASYFSTYGAASALDLRSSAGNVRLLNDIGSTSALRGTLGSVNFGTQPDDSISLRVYPGTLSLAALRGNVAVDNSMTLFPAARGNVDIFAHGDVTFNAPTNFELIQSDADEALLPSIASPAINLLTLQLALGTTLGATDANVHAAVPVHLSGAQPGTQLSRVVALNGDVANNAAGSQSTLSFAEPARIVAGRDIRNLGLSVQNLTSADISAIVAGRDVNYALSRSAGGLINPNMLEINVDGPGTLELRAGRNVNLQTSSGISSRGNLRNAALSDHGADISVQVGTGSYIPDYAGFITAYLQNSADYQALLFDYVHTYSHATPTSPSAALEAFRALPADQQAPLLEEILFAELRASGRSAAQLGATNNNFSRGYLALTTLYPGANPDPSQGQANPYSGDMNLYFSRVYTLRGGDIRLLAPGGNINAGLATPPAAFGIIKTPSSLGIVAQSTGSISAVDYGNFAVNESRVFAADGGDILVWSTRGDIDAGRGAKTAISAPPPTIRFDDTGRAIVDFPAALTGSGIQTLATSRGRTPGNVDLFAPRGIVNAGDAGIVAGNLTIAATAVLGADNIKVSGVSVGVPVDAGGLGASLAGVSSTGSSASQAAAQAVGDTGKKEKAPIADAALGWLDVFVEGFGEETCREKDVECLKRQKR